MSVAGAVGRWRASLVVGIAVHTAVRIAVGETATGGRARRRVGRELAGKLAEYIRVVVGRAGQTGASQSAVHSPRSWGRFPAGSDGTRSLTPGLRRWATPTKGSRGWLWSALTRGWPPMAGMGECRYSDGSDGLGLWRRIRMDLDWNTQTILKE